MLKSYDAMKTSVMAMISSIQFVRHPSLLYSYGRVVCTNTEPLMFQTTHVD